MTFTLDLSAPRTVTGKRAKNPYRRNLRVLIRFADKPDKQISEFTTDLTDPDLDVQFPNIWCLARLKSNDGLLLALEVQDEPRGSWRQVAAHLPNATVK